MTQTLHLSIGNDHNSCIQDNQHYKREYVDMSINVFVKRFCTQKFVHDYRRYILSSAMDLSLQTPAISCSLSAFSFFTVLPCGMEFKQHCTGLSKHEELQQNPWLYALHCLIILFSFSFFCLLWMLNFMINFAQIWKFFVFSKKAGVCFFLSQEELGGFL